MRQQESDKLFWIIGLLVAVGVFAGIHIFKGQVSSQMSGQISSQEDSQPTAHTEPPLTLATERSTQSSRSDTQPVLTPRAEPAMSVMTDATVATEQRSEPVIARIYECVINGQRVFSDQLCAADARQRDISAPNRMTAQEAAIGYRPTAKSSGKARQRDAESSNDEAKQAQCEALLEDKNRINSRMRAGYTNNEGERLRARLRKIDSDYYDLRCRYLH